jgi:hypothetical protein
LIVTVCFQSGVWSIKVNCFYAKTLLQASAALHVMFEFSELEKMTDAHHRSSSNHLTYDRFKNGGENVAQEDLPFGGVGPSGMGRYRFKRQKGRPLPCHRLYQSPEISRFV